MKAPCVPVVSPAEVASIVTEPTSWPVIVFVAAPLVFAERMYDAFAVLRTMSAVACFCLLSSSVYLLNDIAGFLRELAASPSLEGEDRKTALSCAAALELFSIKLDSCIVLPRSTKLAR